MRSQKQKRFIWHGQSRVRAILALAFCLANLVLLVQGVAAGRFADRLFLGTVVFDENPQIFSFVVALHSLAAIMLGVYAKHILRGR
jgi:hypothetical protein